MKVKADFHIHSCLSPCGSLEMSPRLIVSKAIEKGLDLIALTDHNSALNCPAFAKVCSGSDSNLKCFYGIELNTIEEAHVLALFDNLDAVMDLHSYISKHLVYMKNEPDILGDQVQVDEDDYVIEIIDNYLGTALDLSIDECADETHSRGGIFIPSHVDRQKNSLISQLGFIPEGKFDAIEISKRFLRNGSLISTLKNAELYSVITGSDSHDPESIGSAYVEIECCEISAASILESLSSKKTKIIF